MTDPGFDFLVLCEFRVRLVEVGQLSPLLDRIVEVCQDKSLLKGGGQQRTDSTHILAAIRDLNRLQNLLVLPGLNVFEDNRQEDCLRLKYTINSSTAAEVQIS